MFRYHSDQTCTAYHPYSGAVVALNEASGWMIQKINNGFCNTLELKQALAHEWAYGSVDDSELQSFFDGTLRSLRDEAKLIRNAAN